MGRPSDKKRSARRPGKKQRARVKKQRRTITVSFNVVGAGTVVWCKAGRKKSREHLRGLRMAEVRQSGNHILKAENTPDGPSARGEPESRPASTST